MGWYEKLSIEECAEIYIRVERLAALIHPLLKDVIVAARSKRHPSVKALQDIRSATLQAELDYTLSERFGLSEWTAAKNAIS